MMRRAPDARISPNVIFCSRAILTLGVPIRAGRNRFCALGAGTAPTLSFRDAA